MRYLKEFITILALVVVAQSSQAQSNYSTAIGLRLGPSYGFTIKHFVSNRVALEGLVTSQYYGSGVHGFSGWSGRPSIMLTGLAEWHFPIGKIQGFNWFVGGGIHIGAVGGYRAHPYFKDERAYVLMGLDIIGGIEYTLPSAPVTFQLDLKPSFHFAEYVGLWAEEFGATVRYTF